MKSLPLKTKLFAITLSAILLLAAALTWRSYQGISLLSEQLQEYSEKNLTKTVITQLQTKTQAYGEQISNCINAAYRIPMTMAATIKTAIEKGDGSRAQEANKSSHNVTEQLDRLDKQLGALRT